MKQANLIRHYTFTRQYFPQIKLWEFIIYQPDGTKINKFISGSIDACKKFLIVAKFFINAHEHSKQKETV